MCGEGWGVRGKEIQDSGSRAGEGALELYTSVKLGNMRRIEVDELCSSHSHQPAKDSLGY
jgi:hypothetical protein